jgi:hypothetical protein
MARFATPLGKIVLHFGLYLLLGIRGGPERAAQPLVGAAARDLQEPTHATHAALRMLLVYPRVLHGSCCAQYAAALFKISRSSFKRVFSFRKRCIAS